MPKPIGDQNGSGMHVHQSLFKGERNAFFDANDPYRLSAIARELHRRPAEARPEITLVTNQWVNSYKRLVPGFEAPMYLSWARRNRSDLIRVPEYKPRQGKRDAHRVPRAGPGLQPVPRVRLHARGRPRGHREGATRCPRPAEENVFEMIEAEKQGARHRPPARAACRRRSRRRRRATLLRSAWAITCSRACC